MLQEYKTQARAAMQELLAAASLTPGEIVVVGCSSSEVLGGHIGKASSPEVGTALLEGLLEPVQAAGLYLAAQCCEHLNRALVVEQPAIKEHGLLRVNAVPQPKAGGSFASAAWAAFTQPALVQGVQAAAGLDIGSTLIGMHLRPVAVPLRLTLSVIGSASLVAARTRPPFIGGERAQYDPTLL